MKILGLASALVLLCSLTSSAQINAPQQSRFEISVVSKSLSQQNATANALIGLEASLYNKKGTSSVSAFVFTSLSDPMPLVETAPNVSTNFVVSRTNFNSVGMAYQKLIFQKNRMEILAGSALSLNWFDETERDFDLISSGPNGFTALEPSVKFSYSITNRFSFKITPSYLIALGSEDVNRFQRLNIGAGLGIRF